MTIDEDADICEPSGYEDVLKAGIVVLDAIRDLLRDRLRLEFGDDAAVAADSAAGLRALAMINVSSETRADMLRRIGRVFTGSTPLPMASRDARSDSRFRR
jgi:hypothetical protein